MATNSIFSGNSRFANDFQTIIDRQVALASLPVTALQNIKSTLASQSGALKGLDTRFTALQSAMGSLENALSLGSFSSSTSNNANTTVLTPSLSSGVVAGSYSLEVTNLGAFANTMSNDGLPTVGDPAANSISSSNSYTLTVNGVTHTLAPDGTGLNALVSAINNL